MRYFTAYWKNDTWEDHEVGDPIPYAASSHFGRCGVSRGDLVFIITNSNGCLHIGAVVEVSDVLNREQALRTLGDKIWPASHYIRTETPPLFTPDRQVPSSVAREIQFVGDKKIVFRGSVIDRQTLRGVRELTAESAARLLRLAGVHPSRYAPGRTRPGRTVPDRAVTMREAIGKFRCAQGIFRKRVVALDSECRVTGESDLSLLRASHIKPWRDSTTTERQDGHNGLLLAPHVDLLFDQGHISFADDGQMLVKDPSTIQVLKRWGITYPKKVRPFTEGQRRYLQHHRAAHEYDAPT